VCVLLCFSFLSFCFIKVTVQFSSVQSQLFLIPIGPRILKVGLGSVETHVRI